MKVSPIRTIVSDKLVTNIYTSRDLMGKAAAHDGADFIRKLLNTQQYVNVIFAAAPSQNETLKYLIEQDGIDWSRVRAFHMDEYVGLDPTAPQAFGTFLRNAIFSKLPFKEVHYLAEYKTPESICNNYTELLKKYPVDIVFMGIGENAHIAFNDPHVASFTDKQLVKLVALDEVCRHQQVNDGCFDSIDKVPTHAVTLTVPALFAAKRLICTVPAATKANAVVKTIYGKVQDVVPATVMRMHENATMYLDCDSAKKALFKTSVITDEISQDFEVACQLASSQGLSAVEVRSVYDTAPEELSDKQIEKITGIAANYGLGISALCSSVLKCKQGEENDLQLNKAVSVAKKLGCKVLRAFTYFADGNYDEGKLVKKLQQYADILSRDGLVLALENEPSVNASSGEKVRNLVEKVNRKNVGALWDPGNNLYGEKEKPLDGYQKVKQDVVHVHLKDAVQKDGKAQGVALGAGELDLVAQLKQLVKDNYQGYVTVETHYKKNSAISDDLLLRPFGSAFSEGGYESTEECIVNMFECFVQAIK